jgi:hypothetical protein
MTGLPRRIRRELVLTPLRSVVLALFILSAAATGLPDAWGERVPSLLLAAAVVVGVTQLSRDRTLGRRRRNPYPTVFSQTVRGVLFTILGFGSLALVFVLDADTRTTASMAFIGVVSLVLALAHAFALRRPAIRGKPASSKGGAAD